MLSRSSSFLFLTLLAACAAPTAPDDDGRGPGGKADDTGGSREVIVSFGSDFETHRSDVIRVGDTLEVWYDLDRLSECRGTNGGRPAWYVTGFWRVDGRDIESFSVSVVEGDTHVEAPAFIRVPDASEIEFWFLGHNRWGCAQYDSNYGENWVFPIEPRD